MNYDDTVIYFFYLVYMLCLLHVLDRQIEYMSRVDFLSQKVRSRRHCSSFASRAIPYATFADAVPFEQCIF